MDLLKPRIAVLALALVAASCASSSGDDDRQLSDAATAIEALAASDFNGVVAVANQGDIDIVGFGLVDPAADLPIDSATVFDVGSITKQFTAAAIVHLHVSDELSVEDRLGDYIEGLPGDKADITLHQLLTHTAGLPDSLGFDYDPVGRDEYLALVADTPLDREPGSGFRYSNVGYSLLAAVIEVVTNDTYERFLRSALFEPAGMVDTGYVLADWSDNTVAVGFLGEETFGRPDEQVWSEDGPYWHLLGNGGILSTAEDMLRWDEALRGEDLFDAQAKAMLFAPHVPEGGPLFYGYGWSIEHLGEDRTLITHNGGNGVFFADFLRFVDDDLTVFLATNSADPRFEGTAPRLASDLLGEPGGGADSADCPPVVPEDVVDLAAIVEFPTGPAGDSAKRVFDVIGSASGSTSGADLAAFVDDLVRPELEPDAVDEDVARSIDGLRDEVAPLELDKIVALDGSLAFAALYTGSTDSLVISVRLSDGDPSHLLCLNIDG